MRQLDSYVARNVLMATMVVNMGCNGHCSERLLGQVSRLAGLAPKYGWVM